MMVATLEIHFLTLKYTHCQFCQNYPKKVAKIKLILAKLAFATDYEVTKPIPNTKGFFPKCFMHKIMLPPNKIKDYINTKFNN
jgi:hypothetical protein